MLIMANPTQIYSNEKLGMSSECNQVMIPVMPMWIGSEWIRWND